MSRALQQMGFARHLSSMEIFEQANLFAQELKQEGRRLSNVVSKPSTITF